jgi:3-oxoacyl-[acyl-carrier protein] reductase
MKDIPAHIAIVTGASRGIGFAIAARLARAGAATVLADLDEKGAAAASAELNRAGGRTIATRVDVADERSVDAMFAAGDKAFGACSLLVNNAGYVHQAPFEALTVADFDRMVAVHLRGTFLCARRAIGAMLAASDGVIVNIASQLGQIGGVELTHYSAAKAGIIGLTKALAREVSARGVRVNAVAPGPINTPLVLGLTEAWREAKRAQLPLGRFGEPEDIAETVAFLASPAARIYVGQTLGPNSGDVML